MGTRRKCVIYLMTILGHERYFQRGGWLTSHHNSLTSHSTRPLHQPPPCRLLFSHTHNVFGSRLHAAGEELYALKRNIRSCTSRAEGILSYLIYVLLGERVSSQVCLWVLQEMAMLVKEVKEDPID